MKSATYTNDIFLLSLAHQWFFDEMYSALVDRIHTSSAAIKRAKESGAALRYLDTNIPEAILITDQGITEPEKSAVLSTLLILVRNGGIVIAGFLL